MSDPTLPDGPEAEDLSPEEMAALAAALGDLPPPDPARRAAHLAAAMQAFDTAIETAEAIPPPVADLGRARARRRVVVVRSVAAAAALAIVAGFGIVVAQQGGSGSDDMATSAATRSDADTTDESAMRGGAADKSAEAALDSAAPTDDAPSTTASAPAPAEASTAAGVTPPAALPDLGAFDDDAALATALETPVTTIAGAEQGADLEFGSTCLRPTDVPIAGASVAGRNVVVVGDVGGGPLRTVVDLADCSRRPL